MTRFVVASLLALSLGNVAHAATRRNTPAARRKTPAGAVHSQVAAPTTAAPNAFQQWAARPLIERLPYGNPHHPPTLADAVTLVGVADSMLALEEAPDPFRALRRSGGSWMIPHTLVALAHANGRGLEWVTRNLPVLLGQQPGPAK